MVVPEVWCPTTALTLASTSRCATAVACLGSPASSSDETHLLAIDDGAALVERVDRHARAVLGVLAEIGHRTGQRPDVGDPNHFLCARHTGERQDNNNERKFLHSILINSSARAAPRRTLNMPHYTSKILTRIAVFHRLHV